MDEARELADIELQTRLMLRETQLSTTAGRFDEATAALAEAEELASRSADPCLRAEIAYEQGWRAMLQGRYEASQRTLDGTWHRMASCRNPYLRYRLLVLGATTCSLLGDDQCHQARQAEALRVADETRFMEGQYLARALGLASEMRTAQRGAAFAAAEHVLLDVVEGPDSKLFDEIVDALRSVLVHETTSAAKDSRSASRRRLYLPSIELMGGLRAVRLSLRALRHVQAGQLEEAVSLLETATGYFERAGLDDFAAHTTAALGMVLYRLGRRDDAVETLVRAADGLEALVGRFTVVDSIAAFMGSDRQHILRIVIAALIAGGQDERAFFYSEVARARAFLLQQAKGEVAAESAPQGAAGPLRLEIEQLRAKIAAWQATLGTAEGGAEGGAEGDRIGRRLRAARAALDELMAAAERLPRGSVQPMAVTDLPSLREVLAPDTALVSFFFVERGLVAWVIDDRRVTPIAIPWSEHDDDHVACLLARLSRAGARGTKLEAGCSTAKVAQDALWQKLVAPIRPLIQTPSVILVPHGVLHHLPFAALRDPASGQFWLEEVTISYAPSATAFGALPANGTVGGRALVLGTAAANQDPLPWAEREAESVAALLGTKAHVGREAREEIVWQQADRLDVLHLAAHGFFEVDDPRSGRIELVSSRNHDGRLEVRELLDRLRFPAADLVVLSACRTALGDRTRGDDIVGLVRAFMAAGAPTVIASLWPVDDQAASDVMIAFYQQLRAGTPVAEALRHAQLARLRAKPDDDPYYWAAFGLYGVPVSTWQNQGSPAAPSVSGG